MDYDEFNTFCGAFKATSHVVQWGDSHVWKVGAKVFAVGGWSKDKLPAFTFKTSEQNYYFLSEIDGYIPAPYLASRGMKWIQQTDNDAAKDEDLQYYISESYRIVSLGLTKKKQKELGLNQTES
jgi:predicted DNA-binding protein (MmcQ/YjbR family)